MRLRDVRFAAALWAFALLAAACSSGTDAPVATSIQVTPAGALNLVSINATATLTGSVLDQNGNSMPGVAVTWSTSNAAVATVNPSSGLVTAVANGTATVTATAGSLTSNVSVTVAQAVASLTKTGDTQTGGVGAGLANPISVRARDALGTAVVGVSVGFAVTAGGGNVGNATVTTNATGDAQTTWTLGGSAGANTVRATVVATSVFVDFTATAIVLGVPANIAVHLGNNQTALVGFATNVRPAVLVTDGVGQPVAGVSVTFGNLTGGGSLSNATVNTNAQGIAQVGSWTVGSTAGINSLTATAAPGGITGNPVTFNATGNVSTYNITILNVGPAFSAPIQAAFDAAIAKWQQVIYQDVPDVPPFAVPANACGTTHPAINQAIDDVLLIVRFDSIDGPSNILGSAGSCASRVASPFFTAIGVMVFDTADMGTFVADGRIGGVILHEIGHTIGLAENRWTQMGCLQNISTVGNPLDTHFSCTNARAAFDSIGGGSYTGGLKVPVENCGPGSFPGCGQGNFNSHWRETIFDEELMTPLAEAPGTATPMSLLTIASLLDIGYTVNFGAREAYTQTFTTPPLLRAAAAAVAGTGAYEGEYRGPEYFVDSAGNIVRVVRARP